LGPLDYQEYLDYQDFLELQVHQDYFAFFADGIDGGARGDNSADADHTAQTAADILQHYCHSGEISPDPLRRRATLAATLTVDC
jgi:hypothetical protein